MTSSLQSSPVITFGTFDLFHIGHLNILRRARMLGDRLVVGVSTDSLNHRKKGFHPVFAEEERMSIVASLRYVDEVFAEESLEQKADYIRRYNAKVLVMGDDWAGRFDQFRELCEVVYLPRTDGISTTDIKQGIASPKASPPRPGTAA
jgi:glycerol-3-phosphate cytidylyltransferase